MKKLNLKKILSVITVLTLSLGMLCFAGCKTEDNTKTSTADVLDITNISSNGITLSMRSTVIAGDHLEETVTANVTGGSSKTKLVWELDLGEFISSGCLTISPSSDTRSCVVKCFNDFGNFGEFGATLKVYVEGQPNIFATCEILYKGYPDILTINNTFAEMNETETKSIIGLVNRNFLRMDPVFDYSLFKVEVKMSGSVTALCTYYDENGNAVESEYVTRDTNLPKKFNLTLGGKTQEVDFVRFLTSANFIKFDKSIYNGNELNLTSNAVNGRFRLIPEDVVTDTINGVLVDYDLTFTVTLTEQTSGVSNSFSFKLNPKALENNVSNIVLDKDTITF